MLRWVARLASVLAVAIIAFGWGRIARDFDLVVVVLFAALSAVLLYAIFRLFEPGGLAAFEFDEEEDAATRPGRAPATPRVGSAAPALATPASRDARTWSTAPASAPTSRREPAPPAPLPTPLATRAPSPAPLPPRAAPAPPPSPKPRRTSAEPFEDRHIERVKRGGSLWSTGARPAPTVDLNSASVDELAVLPGVDREWAQRIADDRIIHGPFRGLDDLRRIEGLDPALPGALVGRARA